VTSIRVIRRAIPAALSLIVLIAQTSAPAAAADFYAGKTIELVVGSDAGGGFDIYARTLARHMPSHIPGNPSMIVKNMPGAGSGRAAGYISTMAPKDGTSLAAIMPGAIVDPLLIQNSPALFDPNKVRYVGSASSDSRVCLTSKASPTKTFDDLLKRKTTMGATTANDSTRDYAFMLQHAAGAELNVVAGYVGTVDIALAIERGEVEGVCGWGWSSVKAQRPAWITNGAVNIILQVGIDALPELTQMGVPTVWKYLKDETDREAVRLVVGQQVMLRSYIAPPDTPPEQLNTLRMAFDETMQDKDFLADAEKQRLSIAPLSGGKIQELVAKMYATPKDVVERARTLLKP
jgi:tripartite-type tricarboxylate transporter receptor subunit TctC